MTLLDKIKKIFKNPEPPEYILPKDYPAATPDEQKRSPPDGISDESGNRETAGSDSHPGNDAQGIPVDRSGFGDIFDYFFTSESSQKPGPRHGEDLIAYAGITPNAAVTGVDYDLEVTRNEACPSCDGTGSRNRHINTCPTCNGKRQVRKDIQTEHGSFIQVYGVLPAKQEV